MKKKSNIGIAQNSPVQFLYFQPAIVVLSNSNIVTFTPHFLCWKYFHESFMDKNLLHIHLTKSNKLNKKESAPF